MTNWWKVSFALFASGFCISNCTTNYKNHLDQIIEDYYHTYNERQDIEKFLAFYDDNIVFEDIINGDQIKGKIELRQFLDWHNPHFENLEDNHFKITEKIITEDKAVIKGHFTRFKWGQTTFEAMHFTSILTFNKSGKIIQQVDWINYPASLINYNERKNANDWIN